MPPTAAYGHHAAILAQSAFLFRDFCPKIVEYTALLRYNRSNMEANMKATILNHPLMSHKVAILLDKNTHTTQFPFLIYVLTLLLTYNSF